MKKTLLLSITLIILLACDSIQDEVLDLNQLTTVYGRIINPIDSIPYKNLNLSVYVETKTASLLKRKKGEGVTYYAKTDDNGNYQLNMLTSIKNNLILRILSIYNCKDSTHNCGYLKLTNGIAQKIDINTIIIENDLHLKINNSNSNNTNDSIKIEIKNAFKKNSMGYKALGDYNFKLDTVISVIKKSDSLSINYSIKKDNIWKNYIYKNKHKDYRDYFSIDF